MPPTELVGTNEIAGRMGITPNAVRVWRHRGLLPEPAFVVGGNPLWRWAAVRDWARRTGRQHYITEPKKKAKASTKGRR